MKNKIRAKYFNFIRTIQLNKLDFSSDYMDVFIRELFSNIYPYKIAYLFKTNSDIIPLCEIHLTSAHEHCYDAMIIFCQYKETLKLKLANYSFSQAINFSHNGHFLETIDNESIDINFMSLREFIQDLIGEKFSYSFVDNDPEKAKSIAVYHLIVNNAIIPLPEPLIFHRHIESNGNIYFYDADINQLFKYGFVLELVKPVQYLQNKSAYACPIYQLIYTPKDLDNFDNNLQLLNALAKQGDLGKFNAVLVDIPL